MSNIASAINDAHSKVEAAKVEGARYAIECGKLLSEAKATVKHGEWDAWVKANCRFSQRTAQLYMKVAKHVGDDPAKAQRVADLSLREVAAEISTPRLLEGDKAAAHDLLAKWYGADGAVKIRFAIELFDRGEIDQKALRTMTSAVGMTPERAAKEMAQMLVKYVPAERHAGLVDSLAKTTMPELREAMKAIEARAR